MINKKIGYFVTLAQTLSFSKTAVVHSVSQTAISQYIASLEKRLQVRLFDRDLRNVSLTEAGKSYYQYVTGVLQRDLREMELLHALQSGYHGALKVGIGMYEYCSTEDFFSSFLKAHPEIKVDIWQYPYSVLIHKLRTHELDILISDALCENAFSRRELRSRTLFSSPNLLVAAPEVAEKYESVAEMLRAECLITNCEEDGPSSVDMLRQLLMDQFGFVPQAIAKTNSINAQLMMVRAGHGVALVPGFIVRAQGKDLECFDLPEKKMVNYNLMCLCEQDNAAVDLMFRFDM